MCDWDFHPNDYSRQFWLAETNNTKIGLINTFLNEYREMMRFHCRTSVFISCTVIILGFIGIIGSILALITLSQKIFTQVSFLYFKAVNIIELPYMIFLIEFGVQHFFHNELTYLRYRSWAGLVAYGHGRGLVNVFPAWVNVIVLAAAIERAVACHAPHYFHKINKKSICIAVIAIGFPICLGIYLPHIFAVQLVYENRSRLYEPMQTEWGHSDSAIHYSIFADSLAILGVVLHCVTAVFVVWGLIKSTRLRNKLKNETMAYENWTQCLNLCYLQLCETIPFAIFHIFRVAANQMPVRKEFFILPYSAEELPRALANVRTAKLNITFQTLALVFGAMAHSMGFYFYLAFCPNIRKAFLELIKRIWIWKCNLGKTRAKSESSETELQTLRANM